MSQDEKQLLEQRILMGSRIREERKKRGLTIEQMAEKMELSENGYKKIESGNSGMSEKSLRKLQTILGVSFDYILRGNRMNKEVLIEEVNAAVPGVKVEVILNIFFDLMVMKEKREITRQEKLDLLKEFLADNMNMDE